MKEKVKGKRRVVENGEANTDPVKSVGPSGPLEDPLPACLWGIPLSLIRKTCLGHKPSLDMTLVASENCFGSWNWTLTNPDGSTHDGTSEPDSPLIIIPPEDIFEPPAPGVYNYHIRITKGNFSGTTLITVYVYPVLTARVLDNDGNVITDRCWGMDATLNMDGVLPGCQVIWEYSDGLNWHPVPEGGLGNPYPLNLINSDPTDWAPDGIPNQDLLLQFRGTVTCPNLPEPWPSACSNVQNVSLNLLGTPQAGGITASQVCVDPDVPIQLSITPPVFGDTFTWACTNSSGNPSGTFSYPDTQENPTLVIHEAGVHNVSVTIGNGLCDSITQSIRITVQVPVTATIESTKDTVCYGQTAQLSLTNYNGPPAYTIAWEYQIDGIGPWIPSGVHSPVQNTNELFGHSYDPTVPENDPWAAEMIGWHAVIQSHTGDCPPVTTIIDTVTIDVIQPPGKPSISPAGEVVKCFGEPVTLTAIGPTSGTGPFTYEWLCDALPIGTGDTFDAIQPGNYQVRVFNPEPCHVSAESDIVPVRDCIIKVRFKNACTCSHTDAPLMVVAMPTCSVVPAGPAGECHGPYAYVWGGTYLEFLGMTPPVETTPDPFINIRCPGHTLNPGELWLEVTNQLGCTEHVDIPLKRCLSKGGKS